MSKQTLLNGRTHQSSALRTQKPCSMPVLHLPSSFQHSYLHLKPSRGAYPETPHIRECLLKYFHPPLCNELTLKGALQFPPEKVCDCLHHSPPLLTAEYSPLSTLSFDLLLPNPQREEKHHRISTQLGTLRTSCCYWRPSITLPKEILKQPRSLGHPVNRLVITEEEGLTRKRLKLSTTKSDDQRKPLNNMLWHEPVMESGEHQGF